MKIASKPLMTPSHAEHGDDAHGPVGAVEQHGRAVGDDADRRGWHSGPAAAIQPSARGVPRLAIEAGDAAERPQVDRRGADAVVAGDEGVGQLVGQDRGEENDHADGRRGTDRGRSLTSPSARTTAITTALQWILSVAPASRPMGMDPLSIVGSGSRLPAGDYGPVVVTSSHSLVELRAPEVVERLGPRSIIVQPLGAVEQHGPHLPLHTDLRDRRGVAHGRRRARRGRGRCLAAAAAGLHEVERARLGARHGVAVADDDAGGARRHRPQRRHDARPAAGLPQRSRRQHSAGQRRQPRAPADATG